MASKLGAAPNYFVDFDGGQGAGASNYFNYAVNEDINWLSVASLTFVLIYNIGRLVLLLTVYQFDRQEAVYRRRVVFALDARRKLVWNLVSRGYFFNLLFIAINTVIFLHIQVPNV